MRVAPCGLCFAQSMYLPFSPSLTPHPSISALLSVILALSFSVLPHPACLLPTESLFSLPILACFLGWGASSLASLLPAQDNGQLTTSFIQDKLASASRPNLKDHLPFPLPPPGHSISCIQVLHPQVMGMGSPLSGNLRTLPTFHQALGQQAPSSSINGGGVPLHHLHSQGPQSRPQGFPLLQGHFPTQINHRGGPREEEGNGMAYLEEARSTPTHAQDPGTPRS